MIAVAKCMVARDLHLLLIFVVVLCCGLRSATYLMLLWWLFIVLCNVCVVVRLPVRTSCELDK